MSRRLLTLGTALLLAIAWAAFGYAQESKFAFFDMQKFMQKSTKAQAQQKKLQDLVNIHKGKLQKMQKEYEALTEQAKTQASSGIMNEQKRSELIVEIEKKKVEAQYAEKEAQSAVETAQRAIMEKLQEEITGKIKDIRTEKHLAFIFNSVALVSADDHLDVTEEVIKAYDSDPKTGGDAPPKARAPQVGGDAGPAGVKKKPVKP